MPIKKKKITPLADRMLVMADKEDDMTASGLYLAETTEKDKKQIGTVIAKGDMVSELIKPDCRIMFGKYAGTDIMVDNVSYLILKEEEVLCVIEDQ